MYIKKGENYFDDEPLSTLNFLGHQILFSIPILGIIMLLICSFSKELILIFAILQEPIFALY